MKSTIGIFLLSIILLGQAFGQPEEYEPKKVPSAPLNIQKLTKEIYDELIKVGGTISIGGKQAFYLSSNDKNVFEFLSSKAMGYTGEKVCQFLVKDGKVYYSRAIDFETGKTAQGVLYNDIKDKWERYLKAKEKEEKRAH